MSSETAENKLHWVLPRLPSPPSMGDIHYLLMKAVEERGHSFDICWNQPGSLDEYVLSVEANPSGGDAQWKMFTGLVRDGKPLWTYISCDVLLVFNLVTSTARDQNKSQLDSKAVDVSASPIANLVRRDVTTTSQGQAPPIKSGSGKKAQALAGDLSMVQMPTLLQSILMAKMTGILEVEDTEGKRNSQVFFVDGQAVHAVAADSYGEEGILELLGWKDGTFNFKPNETYNVRTIKHPLDSLLLQGMTLLDNAAFLSNLGVTPETHLKRTHAALSDAEIEAHSKKGAPVNMKRQITLYHAISPEKPLKEILAKLNWPRSQWCPILSNLMKTELLAVADAAAEEEPLLVLMEPKRIDKTLIQSVMMSLRNPETGLFTYAAFLYFMEQEYFRAYRAGHPLSVVVFQMRVQGADAPRQPLSLTALSSAVRRISGMKRYVDLLAHYEANDYVLLLPNTKASGAEIMVNRLIKGFLSEALVPGVITPENFKAAFGIACIPEDFRDLSLLLTAAEIAKNLAATGPHPIVLFSQVRDRYALPDGTPVPPPIVTPPKA